MCRRSFYTCIAVDITLLKLSFSNIQLFHSYTVLSYILKLEVM